MSVVVEQLTVRYGEITAVDNVSFTAPSASVTVILGPNGAGKTSTIEVCEGFRRAASGTARVLGLDPVADHRQLTNRMGVMLQGGGVYPSARVGDVISHFCALYDKGVDASGLIDSLGLAHRTNSVWRRLSGGEQQRVSLALALAADPEVVFLDEPTSGVDIEGRDAIARIITDLAMKGATVVMASHDMAEAQRVATHVVLFNGGRVIASGTPSDLATTRSSLRFSTNPGANTMSLSAMLGAPIREISPGQYEADQPPSPYAIATVTRWLADNNLPILGIDVGTESLEEIYRRLTGSGQ